MTVGGTVQIPVDSFHATSGGRKMVITHEIHWIDHHRAPQRQHYEVYQTPRCHSSTSYPHCHAGLAQSRRLRQNDADRPGLSPFQDLALSTPFGGHRPARSALQRTTPEAKSGSFVGATRLVMTLGRSRLHRESLSEFQTPRIPAQRGGPSQHICSR
jgi:hypothetical protein